MNLVLSLTEGCNLRCRYCYYRETHGLRSKIMSDEVLEASIKYAFQCALQANQNDLHITFFGGEPLLRFEAVRQAVSIAKSLSDKVDKKVRVGYSINTNGTLLTDEIFDFLKKEDIKILLSLDGSRERHDSCRHLVNGQGSFSAIEPNLPKFVAMDATVLSVVTHDNLFGLADSVKWFHEQGFKRVVTAVDFDGKWTEADFDSLKLEYQEMARFWVERKKTKESFYLGTIEDKVKLVTEKTRYRQYSCSACASGIYVATDGAIFPCSRFVSSKPDAPYRMGNVFAGMDELKTQKMRTYLQTDKAECEGCALRYRCVAHECSCISFYTTGSIEGVSPEVCTHERMLCEICDEAANTLIGQ